MTDSHGESKQKAQTIFYLDSIFFNSFSYRRRVTRVDKSWKIRRKILSLPFRKTKFVLIQSQNGNLSIATREEETRFRFKFETTVRYAETIRSDLKTDSDTHTHTHKRAHKTKESSLFRPWLWNLAKKLKTVPRMCPLLHDVPPLSFKAE